MNNYQDQDLNFIFQLNSFNNGLDDAKNCSNSDLNTFKEICLSSYLTNYGDLNKSSKLIEFLLLKAYKFIIQKSKSLCLIDLTCTSLNDSDVFKCNLATSGLIFYLKSSKAADFAIIKKTTDIIELVLNNDSTPFEDLNLNVLVLIKNVFKRIDASSDEANKIFLVSLSLMHKLHPILFKAKVNGVLSNENPASPYTDLYIINKYLKCLQLQLGYLNKSSDVDISIKFKQFLEFLLVDLFKEKQLDGLYERINKSNTEFVKDFYIKLILLGLKFMLQFELALDDANTGCFKINDDLKNEFKSLCESFKLNLIYIGQDDDKMIDFNLDFLNYQLKVEKLSGLTKNLFEFDLNYNILFTKLAASVSFDYQVFIDWLISNETNFLTYLVKYLKFLLNELNLYKLEKINKLYSSLNDAKFKEFIAVVNDGKRKNGDGDVSLDGRGYLKETFDLLVSLNRKIKTMKSVFPYNCEPLIKLLDKIVLFIK
jgi:hypothetical protein